eukprot:CAMPEP_0202889534 /NCGR_PEP_ID=MMETSP1392-20130828/117_1 /ASSEMBLY_ACC=CAM_ASM_000868 /TAXON_ID=225041 /ORGANISM="Chlamydomonas chlamydogama, Strain SAG 11-48b" /LENGTH=79 /DNA_ID=CAMNT_0049572885 /DNA_START=1680 /DNA_END=1919 /DNA_ORIENTATION=-
MAPAPVSLPVFPSAHLLVSGPQPPTPPPFSTCWVAVHSPPYPHQLAPSPALQPSASAVRQGCIMLQIFQLGVVVAGEVW